MARITRKRVSKKPVNKKRNSSESYNESQTPIVHFPEPNIVASNIPVTIGLIGCGGTGSHILQMLVKLNLALQAFDHPGIIVYVNDPDIVSESNVVRQVFSKQDIGYPKAMILVEKINRIYGFKWNYSTLALDSDASINTNIVITATDTIMSRKLVAKKLSKKPINQTITHINEIPFYWIDCGNTEFSGQIILGTTKVINQPKSELYRTIPSLKNVVQVFPGYKKMKEPINQPSCSVAESLSRQDLMINNLMATYAVHLLWTLFREPFIETHGYFVNLRSGLTAPLKIS